MKSGILWSLTDFFLACFTKPDVRKTFKNLHYIFKLFLTSVDIERDECDEFLIVVVLQLRYYLLNVN